MEFGAGLLVSMYLNKRRKTEQGDEKKALIHELTTLKSDGGALDRGSNLETYNYKLLQKVTKKAQKKEEKLKEEALKKLKKGKAVQKMIETKKKKKAEAEAAAAAAAAAAG